MVKRSRVRLRARLDEEESKDHPRGWVFEISNLGDIPVTLTEVSVSPYKRKKRPMLWVSPIICHAIPYNRLTFFPFFLETKGIIRVLFNHQWKKEDILKITARGKGYLFIKTDCGYFRGHKFKYKAKAVREHGLQK